MPHVIYATLALALLGLASLSQHRSELHEQDRAIASQMEAVAQSVAVEIHESISVLPFDAVSTRDTTALTPEVLFGSTLSGATFSDATDLDDVHGVTESISRTLTDPTTGTVRSIAFTAAASVQYVRLSGGVLAGSGGTRTFTKEVLVHVSASGMTRSIRLPRTYSHSS